MALNFQKSSKHGAEVRNTMGMIETNKLARFLWGDIYYNLETRKFQKTSGTNQDTARSFVHFILEPFYKIISLTLTSDKTNLQRIMKIELGGIDSQFKKTEFELDIKPLLKLVMSRYFGKSSNCLADVMVAQFPTAKEAN